MSSYGKFRLASSGEAGKNDATGARRRRPSRGSGTGQLRKHSNNCVGRLRAGRCTLVLLVLVRREALLG